MIQSPPAIIAAIGMLLVLAGLSVHAAARLTKTIGAAIAPIAGTTVQQASTFDLGQANWFIAIGIVVAILGGVIWLKRR